MAYTAGQRPYFPFEIPRGNKPGILTAFEGRPRASITAVLVGQEGTGDRRAVRAASRAPGGPARALRSRPRRPAGVDLDAGPARRQAWPVGADPAQDPRRSPRAGCRPEALEDRQATRATAGTGEGRADPPRTRGRRAPVRREP